MVQTKAGERGLASLAQEGIWVTERTGAAGTAFHMPLALWLDGELDTQALLEAWDAVVARQPVLACALKERDGALRLVPAATPPRVTPTDVPVAAGTAHDELERRIRQETLRGFDLGRGPLARATLLAFGPGRHVLLLVVHHAVFDGVSKDVLVRDLATAYRARLEGGEADLPRLPADHAVHALAERERVTAQLPSAEEFWKARWREPEAIVLPGQGEPPRVAAPGEVVTFDGLAPGGPLWQDVTTTARAVAVTPFELLLAALHTLLYRYGNAEPAVAVDLSTRTAETSGHVGLFVNELPVFSAPSPRTTFRELALSVRAELRELYRFRGVPLARAVPGIRPRAALVPVSLSYRARGEEHAFPGLDVAVDWAMFNHAARNALHVQVVDSPGRATVGLQFSPDTIGRDQVTRIAGHLRTVLRAAAADPDARLDQLGEVEWERLGRRPAGQDEDGPEAAPAAAPPAAAASTAGLAGEIAGIWREVLQLDDIRMDDDLFDLGGHSLTVMQIIARVHERLRVEVSLEDFFESPTITGMIVAITGTQPQPADT